MRRPGFSLYPYSILVQAGTTTARREWRDVDARIQRRYVDAVIMHPEYLGNFLAINGKVADLALLHLRRPLEFNTFVSAATIGDAADDGNPSDEHLIVGWGEDERTNFDLDQHAVRIIDTTK